MVYLQGHPEYDAVSLLKEYKREVTRYLDGELDGLPPLPENYLSAAAARRAHDHLEAVTRARERGASRPRSPRRSSPRARQHLGGHRQGRVQQLARPGLPPDRPRARRAVHPRVDPDDPLGRRRHRPLTTHPRPRTTREGAPCTTRPLAIHAGYEPDPTTKAVAVPIYQTVAYEFDDAQHGADLFNLAVPGNIYTRIMNPTQDVLEQRLAALEGGVAALATSSGQAAITYAIQTITAPATTSSPCRSCTAAPTRCSGTCCRPRASTSGSPRTTPRGHRALIDDRTKAVYLETIGNPAGNIPDLEAIAEVAHAARRAGDRRLDRRRPRC
jgi:hypothetical protein